ncbi:predicted protein [Naegleria gruberi]|uniref:Predicted protein n=1 Tax=Naegleria gruberi TaxID=5762 RepID=D2VC21_NAEGR|nr:uncharacterized protein NAEGRDRAFT_32906 [Naegleria gruberi]EFC45581.1 predicted protein [Naegleria gruberi]|eukprot:XP_002678325.1 predicted protein [Naegleria gruberi strain NEG-M]
MPKKKPSFDDSDHESEEEVEEVISRNHPVTISDDQIISDLWEVFNSIDKNQDGVITFMELKIMLKRLNQFSSDAEVQSMIKNVAESNDLVDFQNFVRVFMDSYRDSVLNGKELKDAFSLFDTNDDGKVSKAEMRNVMKKIGLSMIMSDAELDQLFGMVDKDGEGNIDFDQFVQLFLM